MIFLDTNVVVGLINRPVTAVRQHYKAVVAGGATIAVSSIVVFEMRDSVAKSAARAKNAALLDDFLLNGPMTLTFDADDAAVTGDLRATLDAAGTPIGAYDLLIAAQALRHNATLVTANVREFSRVTALRVTDWTAP